MGAINADLQVESTLLAHHLKVPRDPDAVMFLNGACGTGLRRTVADLKLTRYPAYHQSRSVCVSSSRDGLMNVYVAEFLGTALLILLGNGVVANVLLKQTKGHDSGWLVITTGWGLAVFTAVLCFGDASGAHINPAVTIGVAAAGLFDWSLVPGYIVAQMLGGIVGGALVWLFYKDHYAATDDADAKLGTFCNAPAIRNPPLNLFCEAIATFVLVYAVLRFGDGSVSWEGDDTPQEKVKVGLGSLGAVWVGMIVFAVGICLGGTTGYAINPARDLGPRIAHALLLIPGKRDPDWGYSWIPVVGPILGGILAAVLYLAAG